MSAGLGMRMLAVLVDTVILMWPIAFILFLLFGQFSLTWTQSLAWQIPYLIYLTVLPVIWNGYIIGKRIVHIRVQKMNGERLKLSDMFMREVIGKYVMGIVTFGITTLVSAVMVFSSRDNRAIHDFLAGTFVQDEN